MFYRLNKVFSLVLILLSCIACAQSYTTLSIPDSLLKNANAVIRQSHTNAAVKPGSAIYTEDKTITILNSTAEDLSEITIPYDKLRKIKSFKAELYDNMGNKIKQFDKRDAEDYSNAGDNLGIETRFKFWNLKGSSFPYTIHYIYEVELLSLFYVQNWVPAFGSSVSIENATFHLSCSDIHVSNKSNLVALKNHSADEYTWELSGFKAIKKQAFSPNNFDFLPYVLLTADEFELYGVKGSSKTWNDFGRFVYQLNEKRENLEDVNIPEVDLMLSTLKTNQEKIQFLYRYLQNNYRYVSIQLGIGGWQAQTAKYTLQQKFGDCKALVTLMKGLLKKAGIPSYMTLVSAQKNRIEPQSDFVHTDFNHVILCIPNNSDTIWLECTSHIDPYNYLGSFTEGRNVLILNENGGTIARTPTYTEKANSCHGTTTITLAEDGSSLLTSNVTFEGEKQDQLRALYYDSDKKNLQLAVISAMDLSNTKSVAFNILAMDSNSPKISIKASIVDNSTIKKTASRIMINPSILDPFKDFSGNNDNRTLPFKITEGVTYFDTLTFSLPSQFFPENFKGDERKSLTTQFGSVAFSLLFDSTTNQLIIFRKGIVKEQVYPSSDYKAFGQFMLDAENMYSPTLVLKKAE
ncbi:MAG: DUF3857 domain-containing protein [Chitinophagales bacterium]|jgi:hypothetical protein|nr:DUF3857 domain-containing protein [Chitinophagales bacterium]